MSDSGFYDKGIPGDSSTDPTWEEQYPYEDENGLLYSEADAQALVESGEYQFVEKKPTTADTPIADWGGMTMREAWNKLPPHERAAARDAYAVEKYKHLKENS